MDDYESEWTFNTNEEFDYIHARTLSGGVRDWDYLLRQALRHLKPGGWLELQESESRATSDDGTHENAPLTMAYQRILHDAYARFGKPLNVMSTITQQMEQAGFVNIVNDLYKVHISISLSLYLFLTKTSGC